MVERIRQYRRINVIGTSGSGKTTFSRKLAALLSLPHVEMDALYWAPGWQARADEQFVPLVEQATAADRWVLDGNYTRTTSVKWANVECVVWLDLPFLQTISRLLRRAAKRAITQEEIWQGTGNRETFRASFFSRESVVLWGIQTHSKNRKQYEAMFRDRKHAHIGFVRIRSSNVADALLRRLASSKGPIPGT